MRTNIQEIIQIPEGITCTYADQILNCKKGSSELSKNISTPGVNVKIESNNIILGNKKGNKKVLKTIKSIAAHIRNIFSGLNNKFVYILEACNVHFPMTLKQDKNIILINNFLGEKKPRTAFVLPNVSVDIKGQKITVSSISRDDAGQTAANIEKATKIRNRDRRIFQDGIYIVERPGRDK